MHSALFVFLLLLLFPPSVPSVLSARWPSCKGFGARARRSGNRAETSTNRAASNRNLHVTSWRHRRLCRGRTYRHMYNNKHALNFAPFSPTLFEIALLSKNRNGSLSHSPFPSPSFGDCLLALGTVTQFSRSPGSGTCTTNLFFWGGRVDDRVDLCAFMRKST